MIRCMSSSPSTSQKNVCEDACEDSSDLLVCQWLTEASMLESGEKTSPRKLKNMLRKSLKKVIMCLSSLCTNRSTCGQLYVPTWIASVSETSLTRSTENRLAATMLSWMALCPLAKNIMLDSGGAMSYVTPPTLEKLRDKHDVFAEDVEDSVSELLREHFHIIKLGQQKLCLSFDLGKEYLVCGQPDFSYFIYEERAPEESRTSPLILVGEVTCSPSIEHIVRGELIFYMMAYYVRYGIPTVGLVIGKKSVKLVIPKLRMHDDLKKLFTEVSYESSVTKAEKKRFEKPWMCSFCDLKHLCPLGREV